MRLALVKDGVVTNVVKLDEGWTEGETTGHFFSPAATGPYGWLLVDGGYVEPASNEPKDWDTARFGVWQARSWQPPAQKQWVVPLGHTAVVNDAAQVGWLYDGATFTAPEDVFVPRTSPKLVIADRLTDEEVLLVASLAASPSAQIQRWLLRWGAASEIVINSAANIAAFGQVFGPVRALAILGLPPTEEEPV